MIPCACTVELLSREGEIEIAKRIEAGREEMIGGICESPLTLAAVMRWRDMLKNDEVLLRDVIDLDATYGGGPDADKSRVNGANGADTSAKAGGDKATDAKAGESKVAGESGDDDDEDDEAEVNVSLSTMELRIKPDVLANFDAIASTYKKLKTLQDKRLAAARAGQTLPAASEKRYEKLTRELIDLMEKVHLNNNRIEQLMDELYGLNRRLVTLEGRLLRLALKCRVSRDDFLERYTGSEIDPNWLRRLSRLKHKGWNVFATKHRDEIKEIRKDISDVAAHAMLDIDEFKRVVHRVQKGEREAGRA